MLSGKGLQDGEGLALSQNQNSFWLVCSICVNGMRSGSQIIGLISAPDQTKLKFCTYKRVFYTYKCIFYTYKRTFYTYKHIFYTYKYILMYKAISGIGLWHGSRLFSCRHGKTLTERSPPDFTSVATKAWQKIDKIFDLKNWFFF